MAYLNHIMLIQNCNCMYSSYMMNNRNPPNWQSAYLYRVDPCWCGWSCRWWGVCPGGGHSCPSLQPFIALIPGPPSILCWCWLVLISAVISQWASEVLWVSEPFTRTITMSPGSTTQHQAAQLGGILYSFGTQLMVDTNNSKYNVIYTSIQSKTLSNMWMGYFSICWV